MNQEEFSNEKKIRYNAINFNLFIFNLFIPFKVKPTDWRGDAITCLLKPKIRTWCKMI